MAKKIETLVKKAPSFSLGDTVEITNFDLPSFKKRGEVIEVSPLRLEVYFDDTLSSESFAHDEVKLMSKADLRIVDIKKQKMTKSSIKKASVSSLPLIKQYVRTNRTKFFNPDGSFAFSAKGAPIGVLMASYDHRNDTILIGWSLCHSRKDVFDRTVGSGMAFDRMAYGKPADYDMLPHAIQHELYKFTERAMLYFKTAKYQVMV